MWRREGFKLQGDSVEYIPVRVCPLASFDTEMSQGERLATNGMDGGGAGGENGELLSLKDHVEYQEGEKPPSPHRKSSGSGKSLFLNLVPLPPCHPSTPPLLSFPSHPLPPSLFSSCPLPSPPPVPSYCFVVGHLAVVLQLCDTYFPIVPRLAVQQVHFLNSCTPSVLTLLPATVEW